MYFKIKADIKPFNFPEIADISWDANKGIIAGDINFSNQYSLFFFYNHNIFISVPVDKEGKISKSYILVYMDIPNDIELILHQIIPDYPLMNIDKVEDNFWNFSSMTRDKLRSYIIRTIDVLRWRFELKGTHNYYKCIEYCFSLDGKIWFKMPFRKNTTIFAEGSKTVSYRLINETESLMKIFDKEPLEHELYREAWNNRYNNPRSSILMAVSSLEVGLKRLSIELHPQNEWLLENIPSPPVDKILKRYVPLLPAKLDINGEVLVPKPLIKIVKTAIEDRNKLVHTGIATIDEVKLIKTLIAIKDLLYLFDYYRGFKWALWNISGETYNALFPSDK